jgi:hypothetical protein
MVAVRSVVFPASFGLIASQTLLNTFCSTRQLTVEYTVCELLQQRRLSRSCNADSTNLLCEHLSNITRRSNNDEFKQEW